MDERSSLNTNLLATMVRAHRGEKVLRDAAKEIGGISPSTLSRIEQGHVPDVETFIKVCQWLDEPTETFVVQPTEKSTEVNSGQQKIIAHLRAEKTLSPKTVEMLVKVIELAYMQD
jgi:transcriptional regulator with XRE-family HTH domain